MKTPLTAFEHLPAGPSGTVTWIHIGDTHITKADEQSAIDLGRVVDEINEVYAAGGVDFVFVPGDIADNGSAAEYEVFRSHLDRLKLPWFAIVGDHDVHEHSFENFRRYVCPELYGSFEIGGYRFFRLNAFSEPRPDSFVVDEEQLAWLERELDACQKSGKKAVLFLHCYPSDLKRGGEELKGLLQRYPVLLVEMGHTHYNEISNDGTVLYTATRSTGQVEEGPVGYSLTTLDGNSVSWHFFPLGQSKVATVTSPVDERLATERTRERAEEDELQLRAKVWAEGKLKEVLAHFADETVQLRHQQSGLWTAGLNIAKRAKGSYEIVVRASSEEDEAMESKISYCKGPLKERQHAAIDQGNAIGRWEDRGLLGTQLGPNKNGRKW